MPKWFGTRVEFFNFKDWWHWVGRYKADIQAQAVAFPHASTCLISWITYYDQDFSPAYGNPGNQIFKCPCLVHCYRDMFRREYNTGIGSHFLSCTTAKLALHDLLEHQGPMTPISNVWFLNGLPGASPVYST